MRPSIAPPYTPPECETGSQAETSRCVPLACASGWYWLVNNPGRGTRGGQKVGLKIAGRSAIFVPMVTQGTTPTNQRKVTQLREAMAAILLEILQRGFHGTAGIELSVQDGTIQHIRRRVERIER